MLTPIMISQYLHLLGCENAKEVSAENLFLLHRKHLEKIPYTNWQIYFHAATPSLETGTLFNRIISGKLGGYCFELNGLFAELLRSLGYQVTEYFGRWHAGETADIPMRRHRILRVQCGEKTYLADVGVGCLIYNTPLEFIPDIIQKRNIRSYRIIKDPRLGNLVQADSKNGFYTIYSFTEDPHFPHDFEYVNFYCSQMPESPFRKKIFLHKQSDDSRIFLENPTTEFPFLSLCEMNGESVIRTPIKTDAELSVVFRETFGIDKI